MVFQEYVWPSTEFTYYVSLIKLSSVPLCEEERERREKAKGEKESEEEDANRQLNSGSGAGFIRHRWYSAVAVVTDYRYRGLLSGREEERKEEPPLILPP